jgi:hypothetical protein
MTKNTASELVEFQNNVPRGLHVDIGSVLIETPLATSAAIKMIWA